MRSTLLSIKLYFFEVKFGFFHQSYNNFAISIALFARIYDWAYAHGFNDIVVFLIFILGHSNPFRTLNVPWNRRPMLMVFTFQSHQSQVPGRSAARIHRRFCSRGCPPEDHGRGRRNLPAPIGFPRRGGHYSRAGSGRRCPGAFPGVHRREER